MKATHPNTHSKQWVKDNFNDFISYIANDGNYSMIRFYDGSLCFYEDDLKIATITHISHLGNIKRLIDLVG